MIISSLIFWSWGSSSLQEGDSLDVGLFSNSEASQGTITNDNDENEPTYEQTETPG